MAGALFGDDGVFGEPAAQALDDGLFGAAVGLGHQVGVAFVGDVRRTAEFLEQNLSRFLGRLDGRL